MIWSKSRRWICLVIKYCLARWVWYRRCLARMQSRFQVLVADWQSAHSVSLINYGSSLNSDSRFIGAEVLSNRRVIKSNSILPLAITCGDPAGVGPEVIESVLREDSLCADDCFLIGSKQWASSVSKLYGLNYEAVGHPNYMPLSLIHIWRCRRLLTCRSRWSPYH